MSDKVSGLKEEMMGKLKKDPEMAQHGFEKRTGELKKKEMEEALVRVTPACSCRDLTDRCLAE
jgi:predicted nucleic acid-binding Zn ribbon protein